MERLQDSPGNEIAPFDYLVIRVEDRICGPDCRLLAKGCLFGAPWLTTAYGWPAAGNLDDPLGAWVECSQCYQQWNASEIICQ